MKRLVSTFIAAIVFFTMSSIDESNMAHSKNKEPISNDVSLVYITDDTLKSIGSFPMTRDHYARFVDAVYGHYRPKSVYIDIIIDMPSKESPQKDDLLFESVKGRKNLVFCSAVSKSQVNHKLYTRSAVNVDTDLPALRSSGAFLPLPPIVANGALASFSNALPNTKGLIDSFPTLVRINETLYLSTPLLLSMLYLDIPWETLIGSQGKLTVQGHQVDVDFSGQFEVDFKHDFKKFTYVEIISGRAPAGSINGRIVILGVLYTGAGDYIATPVNTRLQGTEYVAHATQTLVDILNRVQ